MALEYSFKSLEILEKLFGKDTNLSAIILNNIGAQYFNL